STLSVFTCCYLTRPPPTSTLFPYTTLFRSVHDARDGTGSRSRRAAKAQSVAASASSTSATTPFMSAIPAPANAVRAWITSEVTRSEEHTSELQSRRDLVCRLLLEKKKHDEH